MAYKSKKGTRYKKSSYRTTKRSNYRRTAKKRSYKSSVNTLRIVIEQPQSDPVSINDALAPKKSKKAKKATF